jgi:hypothetical protein
MQFVVYVINHVRSCNVFSILYEQVRGMQLKLAKCIFNILLTVFQLYHNDQFARVIREIDTKEVDLSKVKMHYVNGSFARTNNNARLIRDIETSEFETMRFDCIYVYLMNFVLTVAANQICHLHQIISMFFILYRSSFNK